VRAVAAVILAAGASSRLGRPKQLLMVRGKTLIARAVDTAIEAGCDPVVVVLGRDAEACKTALGDRPVVCVENIDWATGMGSSLRVGVRTARSVAAEAESVCVLLADQPNVTSQTLRRLIETKARSDRPIAVASFAGTVGPPVIVSGPALERLMNWPNEQGAKALWLAEPNDVLRVECPEAEADVDTEEDYARLTDRE
jgi:molybdenum cofactor cytidylyltransferase